MYKYLLLFFSSFALSFLFTPFIRSVALKYRIIAKPRGDRWHKRPIALLGGIAIFLASFIPIFLFNVINKHILGLLIGGTFLFLFGLADDRFGFTPYTKIFAQIIAGSIAILFGIILGLPFGMFLTIPLTLLWIVLITNSFNLLDNIDGLAAGIAGISSIMLFLATLIYASNPLTPFALILAGAALGFLPYNFNPAKIFMGDAGSMFLGYSLAMISIAGTTTRHVSSLFITLLIPVLILSVPIFDSVFVMVLRKLQRKSIFEGGKDHTSHHLVTLGLSQRKTVLLLYTISIVFGLIAFLYPKINTFVISVIAILAIVILLFFGLFLSQSSSGNAKNRGKNTGNIVYDNSKRTLLNSLILHKRRIVEVILDFVFICIAYYAAYFLRFEGKVLAANLFLIEQSLIWIILIKMSIFFGFGLYRGVWKYISISDLLTIFKVVTLGTIGSILAVTFIFRFQEYSRAVFFIDWILLLFLISGSRILFRVLGEFFSRVREKGSNVLIFGAGDTGEMVIREIKRNKALSLNPVGFIDDDPFKLGNKIQGTPVLGSRAQIKDLIQLYAIKEVLVAIPSIDTEVLSEIAKDCKDYNIPYRRIKGILDREEINAATEN